jgi:hypothetical protein
LHSWVKHLLNEVQFGGQQFIVIITYTPTPRKMFILLGILGSGIHTLVGFSIRRIGNLTPKPSETSLNTESL